MKLSDPKFATLAREMNQERVLVIAIAALLKEKRSLGEIATILETDPGITGEIGIEIVSILDGVATKKPRKTSPMCQMSREWKPSEDDREYAMRYRFSEREISQEATNFVDYWMTRPDKRNWSATWQMRVRSQAERLGKAAPLESGPSVPRSGDGTPRALEPAFSVDWKRAMQKFRDSGWWPRGFGPEPGQPGCRMPPVYQNV